MKTQFSTSFITHFYRDIYKILRNSDSDTTEIWYEVSKISYLKNLDKFEILNFINHFNFIKLEKFNYTNYLSIHKVSFVLESFKYVETDLKLLSNILNYSDFEALIQQILVENGYKTVKNFRFSDKSYFKRETSQSRYEIDVIAISQNYILLVDAKQWKRKDSFSSINKAANLQYQRAIALKNNPEVFSTLIRKILGLRFNFKKYLPFKIMPIIVTIEENSYRLNENQIPLISISKLNGFLQELYKYLEFYNIVEIKKISVQKPII